MSLLVGTLVVLRNPRSPQIVWGAVFAAMAFLAVMVMHHSVPAYSRQQTIFGSGALEVANKTPAQQLPVATVAHEFSEVPFYLQRSDVTHFESLDSQDLANFIARQPQTLLVLKRNARLDVLRQHLPKGCYLQWIASRGPGLLLQAKATSSLPTPGRSVGDLSTQGLTEPSETRVSSRRHASRDL